MIRSDRIPEELVDRWMAVWEASSGTLDRGSSAYWQRGYAWISGERAAGRRPVLDVAAETME
jgi:hypothetical protein